MEKERSSRETGAKKRILKNQLPIYFKTVGVAPRVYHSAVLEGRGPGSEA